MVFKTNLFSWNTSWLGIQADRRHNLVFLNRNINSVLYKFARQTQTYAKTDRVTVLSFARVMYIQLRRYSIYTSNYTLHTSVTLYNTAGGIPSPFCLWSLFIYSHVELTLCVVKSASSTPMGAHSACGEVCFIYSNGSSLCMW